MKKKLFTLLLSLILCFSSVISFVGCGETPCNHQFGEWTTVTEANCTTAGEKTRECSLCHKLEREVIPQFSEHTYSSDWSSDDNKHWKASTCGCVDAKSEEADHDFGEWVTNYGATCTTDGERQRTCTVCQKTVKEVIPQLTGHTYSSEWSMSSSIHWHANTCGCPDEKHDMEYHTGEWVVDTPATCQATGLKTYTCPTCEYYEERTIDVDPNGHLYVDGEWEYVNFQGDVDEYEHWLKAKCGHTNTSKWTLHNYTVGNVCADCGFQKTVTEGLSYVENADHTAYIVTGIGTATATTNLVIPSYHNDKPVVEIAEDAFKNNASLLSVRIPLSVVKIGQHAFTNCNNIEKVDYEGSINDWAVMSFSSLGMPKSKTGALHFAGYTSQYYIDISAPEIKPFAFQYTNFRQVYLTDSVTKVHNNAFYESSLLEYVQIGKNVNYIGTYAFYGCDLSDSVWFVDKNGWKIGNTPIDISSLSQTTLANYLTSAKVGYEWTKTVA